MKRKSRGFSLLELLLVVALVGLVSALVAPSVSNSLTSVRLKTSAKKTAATLRYARNQAVFKKKPFWVLVDKEVSGLAVLDELVEPDSDETEEPRDDPEDAFASLPSSAKVFLYPEGVLIESVSIGDLEIADSQSVFIFYPNGSCSGGEIVLQADSSRSYRIGLNAVLGTAEIEAGEEETG